MKRHPPPPEGAPLKPTVTKTPREALGWGAGSRAGEGAAGPTAQGLGRGWARVVVRPWRILRSVTPLPHSLQH